MSTESPILSFKNNILSPLFSCVGAKACMNRSTYEYCECDQIGTKKSAEILYKSIKRFVENREKIDKRFASFIAFFKKEKLMSPGGYEKKVWEQLRLIHQIDEAPWDKSVSYDTHSPDFSFSVAGDAYFVIGLMPNHPRTSRRFEYPTLVFNSIHQFNYLREKKLFNKIQERVRERERRLHGSIHPNLVQFENRSDAMQYTGLEVTNEWQCPVQFNKEVKNG